MKKKVTSVFASCVAASLIFTAFGAAAFAEEYDGEDFGQAEAVYEDPVYEESVYEEPVYEEPVYEEPVDGESAYEESAPAERTLVSIDTYYDCDGSGNGYYDYVYSDGSHEYEDFYASSESSSESSSYEEPVYEYEETVAEEPVYEEAVVEESSEDESDRIEWTTEQIASIPDVVTGVEDKEYAAGSASKYDIHMGVKFDNDIVRGVLYNTANVDCTTPGEYDMTYFVYLNRDALLDYLEENDIDAGEFAGLDDDSSDRIEITVNAKVVID